ncbi:hypothetical protein QM565_24925 [Geitlerinema splendidum]|nr:hypothetical protein [Geitlerinema splendidum]
MDVLVIEDNLMWSPRIKQTLAGLGHNPMVFSKIPDPLPAADVAILNLGSQSLFSEELVRNLKSQGTYVLAHAGHKETELWEMGKAAGCDDIVSNGNLTFRLDKFLAKAQSP